MGKEDEYRRHAADSLELAQRANSNSDKTRLLAMADAWLDLADRAHKAARRQVHKVKELHPLLRSKIFGRVPKRIKLGSATRCAARVTFDMAVGSGCDDQEHGMT